MPAINKLTLPSVLLMPVLSALIRKFDFAFRFPVPLKAGSAEGKKETNSLRPLRLCGDWGVFYVCTRITGKPEKKG